MNENIITIIDTWNKEVVPYSRCKAVIHPKAWSRSLRRLDASIESLGVMAWVEALRGLALKRGMVEDARVTLHRLTDDIRGVTMIERLISGEYDRWTAPTFKHSPETRPYLTEILRGEKSPRDWLLCPPDVVSPVSEQEGILYCARMVEDQPYLPAWIGLHVRKKNRKHPLFMSMWGLIDRVLEEAVWR